MISQAVVLVRRRPDGIGPATRIAGLSVVGRLLHVLAEAGVLHAWVLGDLDAAETDAILDFGIEQRIGIELARPRVRESETAAVARVSASAGSAVLLVQGDVVTSARTLVPLLALQDRERCHVVMRDEEWTGLAVLPHSLFVRYQAMPQNEAALELLVRDGHATTHAVSGPVRRLLGPGAVAVASRELYAAAHRSPAGDGPIARHLLRPAIVPLVALLLRLRVKATVLTATWLMLGLAAAVVLALTGPAGTPLGVLLLLSSGLLDYADGALARLTHTASSVAVLDTVGRDLVQATVLAALTARSWGEIGSTPTVVAGIAALWFLLLIAGARYARVLMLDRPRVARPGVLDGLPAVVGRWLRRLRFLTGHDVLLVLAVVLTVARLSWIFVWYATAAATLGLVSVARYAFGSTQRKELR